MGSDRSTKRDTRRTVSSVVALGVVVAVMVGLGYFAYSIRPHFNQQRWKDAAGEFGDSPRAAMVNDLSHNYLRVGMTRREVIGLLGKPDREDSGQLFYGIGRVGLGVRSSDYVVVLDNSNRVTVWRLDQR